MAIGKRDIAVLYQADEYGRSGLAGLQCTMLRRGEQIVGEASYQRGTSVSSSILTEFETLMGLSPDAFIRLGSYAPCAAFPRDAVDLGPKVPVATFPSSEARAPRI